MATQVRGAKVGHDLVLLELSAGEYQLVPGFFAEGPHGPPREVRTEVLGAPIAEALGDWLDAGAPSPAVAPPRLGLEGQARPTLRDRADFLHAWAGLSFAYLGRPFAHLLRPLPPSGDAAPSADLAHRCAAFAALLPYAPFQGVCLYRAFFLRGFLARGGHAPRWVFGVRTWPFQAHCWLQEDDLVLNDDPERASRFVPILVA